MSIFKNIRLGLLHVAVAMTFVLINGVLNRVMIYNLGILASVVAVLVVLPYLLSPMQVWIGQYSDTHPLFGYRRTPYIALGTLLCVGGAVVTPHVALLMADNFALGVLVGVFAFGAWGLGYNLAVVAYLSLASDMSTEQQRSRTIAIMWFMMITSIIVTAIITSRALEPYSDAQLVRVFRMGGLAALGLAALGLVGLEPRRAAQPAEQSRQSQRAAVRAVLGNPQARLFFVYLILMLSAILGQDILLEPYGAQEFGMSVRETTQLTATWGAMTLVALLLQGLLLSRWLSKKTGALLGALIATAGLLLIAASGLLDLQALFVPGVAALGFGTGIATSTNLALMLDMTTSEQVGLFIGAWGVADSLARGAGMLMGGVVRDIVTATTGSLSNGYITVFLIEAIMLAGSLLLLRLVDVSAFRSRQPTLTELVALAGDA
ncbi:MAG: BCD family MFS transporter [Kouleothrix sp.]|nr:BCD family MFS transporter [Kouleothrix sp.]